MTKFAGTFVDGTTFSASAQLCVYEQSASVSVSVLPKSLGQGAMSISFVLTTVVDEGSGKKEVVVIDCAAFAAQYVRTNGEYSPFEMCSVFSYRYEPQAWVDASLSPLETCLVVESDVFEPTTFAWKTKVDSFGDVKIIGIDKKLSGPSVTFKLDDKTGLFSGSYGTYKIFGAMDKGTCCGLGTIVGKDGSWGLVWVGVADR